MEIYFPGDDLFAPTTRRRGLPIGNLTSQLFANLYLNPLDHFVKEVLRIPGYVRYVDDFAVFGSEATGLATIRIRIEQFLQDRRLRLHPAKTEIVPTMAPTTFLGFVLSPAGRRLPEANVRRFRNRLRGLRDRARADAITIEAVDQRINAWIAHAEHADTWRLRQAIFRGGRYEPVPGA